MSVKIVLNGNWKLWKNWNRTKANEREQRASVWCRVHDWHRICAYRSTFAQYWNRIFHNFRSRHRVNVVESDVLCRNPGVGNTTIRKLKLNRFQYMMRFLLGASGTKRTNGGGVVLLLNTHTCECVWNMNKSECACNRANRMFCKVEILQFLPGELFPLSSLQCEPFPLNSL